MTSLVLPRFLPSNRISSGATLPRPLIPRPTSIAKPHAKLHGLPLHDQTLRQSPYHTSLSSCHRNLHCSARSIIDSRLTAATHPLSTTLQQQLDHRPHVSSFSNGSLHSVLASLHQTQLAIDLPRLLCFLHKRYARTPLFDTPIDALRTNHTSLLCPVLTSPILLPTLQPDVTASHSPLVTDPQVHPHQSKVRTSTG